MRPLLYGDISAAARRLYAVPPRHRTRLCHTLLEQAEAADAYARSTGRVHPTLGNGSLMAAARKQPLPTEPGFDDPVYCQCFAMVLRALARRR
ncbi:MAG: hypothetical protein OIF47_16415 [Marinibacterium sp.]|nr:hypothetical protein [Marinibacterium sp.]